MVTKQQAQTCQEFHYTGKHDCTRIVGPRGGVTERVTRVRPSGACKTWKTRPDEFRLPVKYGMRESAYIEHSDAHLWHTADDCPLALWPDRNAFVTAVASLFAATPHALVRATTNDDTRGRPVTAWCTVVTVAPLSASDDAVSLARLASVAHVVRTFDAIGDDGRVFNRHLVTPRAGIRPEVFHA